MKKARGRKGEKCPMCGVEFEKGDRVRLVEMTIVYPKQKKPTVKAKRFCHEKCCEKMFSKGGRESFES